MVNTAPGRKLFKQLPGGSRDRKGIGYTIEAFMAVLTLFIFAVGSLNTPPGQDWNRFQSQVSAQDISYVMQETGNMEGFLERGETGSIQTVASTLSEGRLSITGDVEGLPIGERSIGFHVLDSQVNTSTPVEVASADDNRCYENDDLEEINITEPAFDAPILRTEDRHHGVYLYVTDRDPQIPGGSGETDYDSVWVDNGTRCQFSSGEGPYYQDEFFLWGNESDGEPDLHYDPKNISRSGDLLLYQAEQPAKFRQVLKGEINGVETDVTVDTFNFSARDLESYDTLVFREQESLSMINSVDEREERVMEYLEDGSALFLVDLSSSDLDSGFMSRTGLEWKGLETLGSISGATFTDAQASGRVENLFLGHSGSRSGVSLQPGGTISSGEFQLVNSRTGYYNRDQWNATDMSMKDENSPPPGVADSSCDNYHQGEFEFDATGDVVDAWSSELGDDCTDDSEIWGLSIDLDGDGSYESDEKIFVTGDTVTFEGREYTVKIYPATGDCGTGDCAELVYSGSRKIEIVNAREYFPGQDVGGFARAGYESSYSLEDRRLLTAVIYWLGGRQNSFGSGSGSMSTTAVGGVKNSVYMPYRVNLRWE